MSGAFASPRDRLLSELQSQISSGEISATNETALTTALDSIDSTLRSEGAAARESGSRPPSPTDMSDKISSLIDEQVAAGKLTSEQAEELKGVFEQAMQGGPVGAGGPPPGGPPPGGPPPSGGEEEVDASSSTSSDSEVAQLLADFLKLVQDSQSRTSNYGSDGEKGGMLSSASLVLNFTA
jgi:hypothetical protein